MIADRTNDVKVEGTLPGKTVKMSLAADAEQHFINIFTDLYKNRLRAVIREYSTNAFDAHVEAGITRPIEITLPSTLSPYLRIKDFGVGLSVNDITTIYSQYGASTKRTSNDFNGMLGLGCKSAMTYTSQFVVVSVKSGVRVQVVVERHPMGANMQVVDTSTTADANGTEVIVQVKREDVAKCAEEAAEFFRMWKPGTVLVNGAAPKRIHGLRLSDSLLVTEGDSRCFVVMGNVSYPVERDKVAPGLESTYGLTVFAPIGAVHFTPAREALMDTPETEATLAKARADFQAAAGKAVQQAVEAAKTPSEAIDTYFRYRKMYAGVNVAATYRGQAIPLKYDVPRLPPAPGHSYGEVVPGARIVQPQTRWYKGKGYDVDSIPACDWPKAVWITGWDYAKWSAPMRNKLDYFFNQHGEQGAHGRNIFCTATIPAAIRPWISDKQIIDWPTQVKPLQLPGGPTGGQRGSTNRLPGSYDFYVGTDFRQGKPGADIESLATQGFPIFYHHGNQYEARAYVNALDVARKSKFVVVCLGENRIAKFKRTMPKALTTIEAIAAAKTKWEGILSADVLAALAQHDSGFKTDLIVLDPAKLKDPVLAEAVRVAKIDLTKVLEARKVFAKVLGSMAVQRNAKDPLDSYPLYDARIAARNLDHVNVYLNSAYAARR